MKKSQCETCEYKGYSSEICRKHISKGCNAESDRSTVSPSFKRLGKTVVLGACAGVAATFAGLLAAPIIGIKAILGSGVVAKMTAGGAAGAGVNVVRKWQKDSSSPKSKGGEKKKTLLPVSLKCENQLNSSPVDPVRIKP